MGGHFGGYIGSCRMDGSYETRSVGWAHRMV